MKLSFLKYLDPYHYMDLFISYLHNKNINNKILDTIIYILYSFLLAYTLLFIISFLLGTQDGLMIVVSESMVPNLNIGDIVVLTKPSNIQTTIVNIDANINNLFLGDFVKPIYSLEPEYDGRINTKQIIIDNNVYDLNQSGTIIVYYSDIMRKKIIHRAVLQINANDNVYYLTKGDNKLTNGFLDADCSPKNGVHSCITNYPAKKDDVIAQYWFKIPYLGLIKVIPFKLLGLN